MKSSWASNSAVLWREIARTSRRWQTYLGRAAFSMALLGAILLGSYLSMELRSVQDQSQNAQLARYLFISITVFQMLISMVMAPMVSAKAIIEERLEGTLDLLVLTPISAMRLLTSKVLSRVLVLLLIVLGSLPLLAQVVTLGGVSVVEVVLATLGNLVTIVVLGTLGGWFGLFTKSPIIATLASAGWALLAFLALPGIYAPMAVRWEAAAIVSPFFASVGDWAGLAMPLIYVPVVLLCAVLGTRLFELKMANAELRRYFSDDVWSTKRVLTNGLIFALSSIVVLPVGIGLAVFAAWNNSQGLVYYALGGVGRAMSLAWLAGLLFFCTWFYLRLGMDLVDAFEGVMDEMGNKRSRRKRSRGHTIRGNPVRWRESRVSSWGRGGLPLMIGWGLLLFVLLQTGLWLVPGGVLALGVINAAIALLLTVWLSVGSIEQERLGFTLEPMLVSTMPAWKIVSGKVAALAPPTLLMLLMSVPFILLGFPHLQMVLDIEHGMITSIGRGLFSSVWMVSLWIATVGISMWTALKVKNPNSAYGLAFGAVSSYLLLPTFFSWVLRDVWWAALPFRLLVPVTVANASIIEMLASSVMLVLFGVAMLVFISARVRTWGGKA